MAGMKGITVNTAPEAEPHIYAEDDAAIYQAIFGGDGVSTIGQACKATILSNNKVRVADGVICVGGHMARIPYGEYEDCEIMNGQSEKNRNDIIVAKFETTGTGGIDTMTCEVIQGTAGETATDPELTQDDIYTGGKTRELPLYRVKIEGLSIVAVEQMFRIKPTAEELKLLIESVDKKLTNKTPIYGTTALIETPANGYKDTTVKFGKTFSKAPVVVISLSGGSQNTKSFGVQVLSTTASSFVVRTVNGNNSSLTIMVNWCAFPKGGIDENITV